MHRRQELKAIPDPVHLAACTTDRCWMCDVGRVMTVMTETDDAGQLAAHTLDMSAKWIGRSDRTRDCKGPWLRDTSLRTGTNVCGVRGYPSVPEHDSLAERN